MKVADHNPESAQGCLAAYRQHSSPATADRYQLLGGGGVEIRGAGATVELNNGRQLIDMGSYAVPLFGHRPAAVADEVRATLDRLPVTTRLVANPVAAAYLRELSNYVNRADLTRVWLGLNGTDAVEAALKFAVAATRVPSILAVKGGYHGKSLFSLAATWDPARKAGSRRPARRTPHRCRCERCRPGVGRASRGRPDL